MDSSYLQNECGTTNTVWHYSGGSYEGAETLTPGLGYWFKLDSACTVDWPGNDLTINDFPSLSQGWNQIGSPTTAVNLDDVIGNCVKSSGPWTYTIGGLYEKVDLLEPGLGYWIRVENDCKLG
jgi:hypothetical protein